MRRRWRFVAVSATCAGVLASGCASSGVRITTSQQRSSLSDAPPSSTAQTPTVLDQVPTEPVSWRGCDGVPAPYQCGQITVPLDYHNVAGPQIGIAVIRLPAALPGERIGSLVLNPGGPGGSGLSLVISEAELFPASVLNRFDIVGFDPRGVGDSAAVRCPLSFDPSSASYAQCIDPNIAELPHLGTLNVARDMELLRRSLGDEALTYLGFSYGTAIGAVYAGLFPDRVRAMVLDGAVDPDAGLSNTPAGGSDFYAQQDFDNTIATFEELCNASPACPAGPHTGALIDRVTERISTLGVDFFPDDGRLDADDLDDLLVNAMYSTSDWPLLAVALADADQGDASALSALYSWLLHGYPADTSTEVDVEFASLAIRCADFARRGAGSYECADFPATTDSLPVISAVDTPTPVLVVGTRDDPATPARYAPRMAAALGDAVAIEWEGAGHTATLTSECVTDIVAAYLVDQVVPVDGTTCAFVEGAITVAERGDAVFGDHEPQLVVSVLADVLEAEGDTPAAATCVANRLVARGNRRLVVHQLIGVRSPQLIALRSMLEGSCR